jgi:hypothetical protein
VKREFEALEARRLEVAWLLKTGLHQAEVTCRPTRLTAFWKRSELFENVTILCETD